MDSIIIFLAEYLIFVIVALALFLAFKVKNRREFALALIVAGVLAFDLSAIASWLFYNPRPFVAQNIEPLVAHGPDNGFPSQHTLLAMTLTTVIYFYRRLAPWNARFWRAGEADSTGLAAVAFGLTLLVGAGRVWAHVHSWIDILGGLVIGAIAGYAGVKISQFLLTRFSAKKKS